jgi:N-acetylglucosamine-6-phosphate deacetylase
MSVSENAPDAILAERLFDGYRWHEKSAVLIEDGRISARVPWGEVPAGTVHHRLPSNAFLAPGFIDLQVNGGGGVLLNDSPTAEGMRAVARAHRRFGATALLPTFITDTREKTLAAIAAVRQAAGRDGVLGLHLEGPFLNPARAGVHRPQYMPGAEMSDLQWLADLGNAGHSMITLAPERVPHGLIRELTMRGIRVCAGHSESDAATMERAIEEGLSGVTHLFNAMPPFSGRAPGIVGTALADTRLTAGIIVDGLHVDPISVRAAFAAKGAERIALVTDAMPTVGASESQFDLLGTKVALRDGRLVTEQGTLAGAHLDMATAVRNAVQLAHVPLEDALVSASRTPAQFLGIEDRGVIAPGTRADLVALSDELLPLTTWISGAAVQEQ